MRASIACAFFMFISVPVCFPSDTNSVIDLKRKPATFKNLQGQNFKGVLLVRADLDGLVYMEPESANGGRVSFTNLAPATLEALGIPTNRIQIAEARAKSKAKADAAYRQSAAAEAVAIQKRQAVDSKLRERDKQNQALAAKNQKGEALLAAIKSQREVVKQAQRQQDRDRERWIEGTGGYVTQSSDSRRGTTIDSDETRRSAYYASVRALREAQERLEDLESQYQNWKSSEEK